MARSWNSWNDVFAQKYIFVVVFLLAVLGCRQTGSVVSGQGIFISADMPLASYVRANPQGVGIKGRQFYFPELDIYGPSGELLYSGHGSFDNTRVLRELPGSIQGLRPKPGATQLAEVMDTVPDFKTRKVEVLGSRRISVLSVFLEDCHACTIQEDALDDTQKRLLDQGVNLLVLRVSRHRP
ncbi:MAG: hypothetical protein ACP5EP_12560 [Acidobacteriaceae bacterium]